MTMANNTYDWKEENKKNNVYILLWGEKKVQRLCHVPAGRRWVTSHWRRNTLEEPSWWPLGCDSCRSFYSPMTESADSVGRDDWRRTTRWSTVQKWHVQKRAQSVHKWWHHNTINLISAKKSLWHQNDK